MASSSVNLGKMSAKPAVKSKLNGGPADVPWGDLSDGLLTAGTRAPIAIFIITRNEEANLPYALASVRDWAKEVFVLDSGSTDKTREIAESMGAQFFFREWDGYVNQKNWGLDHLPFTAPWIFILDADEAITPSLRHEIIRIAIENRCPENGFYVNRHLLFMGKPIRHCGYYPSWNLRFFRRGKARYEQRAVHEHMVTEPPVGYLKGEMEHYDRRGLEYYIAKHNTYSTLEAREYYNLLTGRTAAAAGSFWGDRMDRRRWLKTRVWLRLPCRWLVRWFYMYLFKLGFLDGRAGFQFCLFISSYEHQITLKLRELMQQGSKPDIQPAIDISKAPPTAPVETKPAPTTAPPASSHRPIVQRFDMVNPTPYRLDEYAKRVLWEITRATLFRFSPRRAYKWRNMLLRLFGGKIGRHAEVRATARIFQPWMLEMAEWSTIGDFVEVYNLGHISIGNHSVVSQRSHLCAGTHDYQLPNLPLLRPPIRIGGGVWVCAEAFIGPGVSIGDNSVVGARAVVTHDVPNDVIVAGNPAKVIKPRVMRSEMAVVAETLSIQLPHASEGSAEKPKEKPAPAPSSPAPSPSESSKPDSVTASSV